MLDRLKAEAKSRQLVTALMTFEPHPRELFTPDSAPARLTSLREKIELLREAEIDYLIVQRFTKTFASIDALTFRDQIVAKQLNAAYVLVGDDFQFGAKRSGDFDLMAASVDFSTVSLPTLKHDTERVSSTAVRNALQQGDMSQAATLLSRPYSIAGRVVGGDQLGRTFGFPTANIQLKHNKPPLFGIFVVEILGLERTYKGVASLGFRPTIHGGDLKPKLEVHIFDFDRDIYRSHLRINFLAKLRDEEKYPDFDTLIAQIQKDCDQARAWFSAQQPI